MNTTTEEKGPAHVERLNSISKLKAEGFEGIDASLEISLFEYGMAWREIPETNEVIIIYRLNNNNFDRCTVDKNLDFKKEFNWINEKKWAEFFDFLGLGETDRAEWFSGLVPIGQKFFDLKNYYSYLEIFGESYWEGFKISKN